MCCARIDWYALYLYNHLLSTRMASQLGSVQILIQSRSFLGMSCVLLRVLRKFESKL